MMYLLCKTPVERVPDARHRKLFVGPLLPLALAVVIVCLPGGWLAATTAFADSPSTIVEAPISVYDRDHWSFRPLQTPAVPAVRDEAWPRRPLDYFVLAKLESESLQPADEADRTTLIRRLSFDLTGLPPTEKQIRQFLNDARPGAYERVVEEMLASPEYGQHWAQFWLDLARFAETDGFEHDKLRENAWQYRDWVIAAFNRDLPYDEFVRMQIAGDLLEPENEGAVIATAFCLSGPDMPDINSQDERKHVLLNEITATVGAVFMSLQVGCAQCHDHKYDPISQADFYRLRAFFDPAISLKQNRSVATLSEGTGKPTMSYLAIRGDWRRPGPSVFPAFLRIADPDEKAVEAASSDQRRAVLAEWLASPQHPLTGRSITNRIWQQHFGRGLSTTPSDFGVMGVQPSHPELLDYLATELIRRGWRIKDLHREILVSSTYRTRSFDPRAGEEWNRLLAADPDNVWWGRFPRRRLDAEVLRDAMFAVSGSLNRIVDGPGVMPPLPDELMSTLLRGQWTASENQADHYRRSVFLFARRNLTYPLLATFDRPSANTSCAARDRSTTAPQALFLLNSATTLDAADRLAQTLIQTHPDGHWAQLHEAYQRVFSRSPDAEELRQAEDFRQQVIADSGDIDPRSANQRALVELCRGLLNTNPFLYVD